MANHNADSSTSLDLDCAWTDCAPPPVFTCIEMRSRGRHANGKQLMPIFIMLTDILLLTILIAILSQVFTEVRPPTP